MIHVCDLFVYEITKQIETENCLINKNRTFLRSCQLFSSPMGSRLYAPTLRNALFLSRFHLHEVYKPLESSKIIQSQPRGMLVSPQEISGTYWLIYVSLAIVSRLTRIIRSIDPTVTNFQVNDQYLWNPQRWKSQFNPHPACYSIYCAIPLRSVGSNLHYDIAFSWKFVLFSIHITLLGQDIYIYTMLAMYVL